MLYKLEHKKTLDAAAVVVAVCLEEDDGKKIKRKYENKKKVSPLAKITHLYLYAFYVMKSVEGWHRYYVIILSVIFFIIYAIQHINILPTTV